MGSCISKCNPKKSSKKPPSKQDHCKCQCIHKNHTTNASLVQDKIVISQPPISSPPKTSVTSLSSSISSPMATSSSTKTIYPITSSSSCSLLSSASSFTSSSSITSSKSAQSFSNEFLPMKVSNPRRASLPTSGRKPNGLKDLIGPSPQRSASQKRNRSNSPSNLTRQKSFRRETEVEPNRPKSRSGRDLRPMSPSSSRRFSGELSNQGRSLTLTSSMKRENCYVRASSPSKSYSGNSRRVNGYGGSNMSNNLLAKKEKDVIKGVSSKIGELTMGDLGSTQNMDLMPIEDVNNPHIALDCFIFL